MKAALTFLIFCVILNTTAQNENGEINGIIYSSDSTTVLKGVKIQLEKTNLSTLSDSDGTFKFTKLNAEHDKII